VGGFPPFGVRLRISLTHLLVHAGASPVSLVPCRFIAVVPFLLLSPLASELGAQGPDPEERSGPYTLEQIVVSASGFEQSVANAPATITVLSRDDLFRSPVRGLSDVLRSVPGVDVEGMDARSNKSGNRTISLRGLPSEYTLVLIDGRRQNVPGSVAPNAFDDSGVVFFPSLAAIERIEVIRGPMSTQYGADALGGVINIITRRPTERWTGDVSFNSTFQSDRDFGGAAGVEAMASGPLVPGALGLQIQSRFVERASSRVDFPGRDWSVDRQRTMGQVPVHAQIRTVGGKLAWTPAESHDVTLGLDATRQVYDNSQGQLGQINSSAEPGSPEFPDLRSGYAPELGFNRDQLYLAHTYRMRRATLHSTVTRNFTETTGRTIPNAAATPESGRRGTPRVLEAETVVAESRVTTPIGAHTLSVGGQFVDASLTDGIPDRTFETSQWGLFVEDEWRTTDRLSLTAGVRYDNNNAFGGQFSPRGYAVYRVTPSASLKAGVARGYRAPFLEQLAEGVVGYGNQGLDPLFGNPDLRPEVSRNVEASVQYDAGRILSGFVSVFHTELRDKIERPIGATGGQTANVGEAVLMGAELAWEARVAPRWTLLGEYTWIRSEVTTSEAAGISEGDPLFGVPAHRVGGRVAWRALSDVEVSLGGSYRSSRFRPDSYHEPHLGGSAQGAAEALGDFRPYALVDLGTSWHVSDRLQLRASIENLLNRDFVDYQPYPLRNNPSVTAFSNTYNHIIEPRRLWLSLGVTF